MQRAFSRTKALPVRKFRGEAVFICGFTGKRRHNSALLAIAEELLPQCYVRYNEVEGIRKGNSETIQALEKANAVLFYVNEYTLKDVYCLFVLQHAFSKGIPVIMIRPPHTRLIIEKASDGNYDQIRSSRNRTHAPNSKDKQLNLDFPLLQRIFHEEFKWSVLYDHLEHEKSMRKIFSRLDKCINKEEEASNRDGDLPLSEGNNLNNDNSSCIHKNQHPQTRTSTLHITPERNFSAFRTGSTQSQTSAMKSIASAVLNKSRVNSNASTQSSHSSSNMFGNERSYHTTQYLIFPIKEKALAPQLIHFPTDVLNNGEVQLKDRWGSDTSLEETAEIAQIVKGNIDFDGLIQQNFEDDPYIDPL